MHAVESALHRAHPPTWVVGHTPWAHLFVKLQNAKVKMQNEKGNAKL